MDFFLLKTTEGPGETFVLILIWLPLSSLPGWVPLNIYEVPHSAGSYLHVVLSRGFHKIPQTAMWRRKSSERQKGRLLVPLVALCPQWLCFQNGLGKWVCIFGLGFCDPDFLTFFSYSIITVLSLLLHLTIFSLSFFSFSPSSYSDQPSLPLTPWP